MRVSESLRVLVLSVILISPVVLLFGCGGGGGGVQKDQGAVIPVDPSPAAPSDPAVTK